MSDSLRINPPESLAGTVIGRFAVQERLGEGGMGEVYRAQDTRLGRSVALKRMAPVFRGDPQYRQKFLKEAERASRFTDPHIAALYDILEENNELFLVMEFVQGRNLSRRLRDPMAMSEFLRIAVECAHALAAAHAHDILHCDIKPENIMITDSGAVKVLDFGVARRLAQDGTATSPSTAGVSGTTGYIAPEIILEQVPTAAADIFSLGVVFYEALAGFHPFHRGGFFETCEAVLHTEPPPLDQIGDTPSALSTIVARMLAKQVADRYQSAADVIEALKAVEPGDAMLPSGAVRIPAGPDTPTIKHIPTRRATGRNLGWVRRRPKMTALAAVAAVLVLFAVTVSRQPLWRWARNIMGAKPQLLAVLPFASTDANPAQQAFAAGLAEAVSARLGGGPDDSVQVVPVSELRAQNVDSVEKARQQFGADLVLSGSLRESGNLVRVSYNLVDARTRTELRGDTITVAAGDPFALEDQVMASLLRSLRLGPQRASPHGTTDGSAYVYYLRGRGYLQDYTRAENLDAAVAEFKNALQRDPNYALAYAGMGQAYWHKFQELRDPGQVGNATLACERALAIDPSLAQAHVCLGTAYINTGRYNEAIQQFQQAVARDPNSDDAVRGLAYALEKAGRLGDAENTFREAIRLRPHYWANYNQLGAFYFRRGRYEEAIRLFQQVITIAPENYRGYANLAGAYIMQGKYADSIAPLQRSVGIRPNPAGFSNLGSAYFFERHFDEAVRAFSQAVDLNPNDYELRGNLADAQYWAANQRDAAAESYRKAIELAAPRLQVNPRDAPVLLALAQYHAMLGENAAAQDFLARATDADPSNGDLPRTAAIIYAQFGDRERTIRELEKFFAGGGSPAYVRSWPIFDSLNSDARYQQLLKSAESLRVH